jgi:EAL domain-containing protein (putative c-di-GMP-specific phosphodiesterase class I)
MAEIGYEILGRIENKDLPLNVAELLDLAESVGCGTELSALFREVGVALGKELPGSPMLFVNTTELEILELDALQASLKRIRDLAPSNKIVLEIHEKAAADANVFLHLRQLLDTMDMQLAFDDFGVGQTRLVELAKISPDYLKFDMSLIRKIHLAPQRLRQMVATFIKAAHDLGIVTLAEGVESPEESAVCEALGFDLGQGFLFGRPSPIDSMGTNLGATFTLS